MDTTRLSGKHVLITGGAQGMGAAVAKHYAAQGAKICVGDINVDGVAQVAADIREAGGEATHIELDVTSQDDAKAAVAHTVEAFGSINVLLNNAGGKLNVMQAAARQMTAQGPQDAPYKIINVGSILSRDTFDDVVVYGMSQHAVLALIKGGAKSLMEHNITVNGYAPGVVRTEMWEQLDRDLVEIGKFEKHGESMDSLAENMILMKRYSYPEDIVGTAAFLASSDSDYMTGQLLMIDGGMVIQ